MNMEKITAIVFSPTESTKGVVNTLLSAISLENDIIDVTNIDKICLNEKCISFTNKELAVFAVPVYGGRVPAPAVERFKKFQGKKTPAVLLATYGNRAYDDTFLELKDIVERNGFIVVAAGAFVTEHSIMHSVATGRPDSNDKEQICKFATEIMQKVDSESEAEKLRIDVPGNIPYRSYGGVPFKPSSDKNCIKCGICADKCPVKAIPIANPADTDKAKCISCMRCIMVCKNDARKLNKLILVTAEKAFALKNNARKNNEYFI